MPTWKEISTDSLAAAKELLNGARHRSAVSRAYYSLYARTCEELQKTATFPPDRDGPSHNDLPDMIYDFLTRLTERNRWLYSTLAAQMYEHRTRADYVPGSTVDEKLSRQQVSHADAFMKVMEAAYG